jgi:sulfur-carrier protein
MKKYNIKAFGVAKEILGGRESVVEVNAGTVAELRTYLMLKYPELVSLRSLFIAVNNSYAEDSTLLRETDEIALIPPVSGG